jgi:hypothetical protein
MCNYAHLCRILPHFTAVFIHCTTWVVKHIGQLGSVYRLSFYDQTSRQPVTVDSGFIEVL